MIEYRQNGTTYQSKVQILSLELKVYEEQR